MLRDCTVVRNGTMIRNGTMTRCLVALGVSACLALPASGQITRVVSVDENGGLGDGSSAFDFFASSVSLSSNGRFVAFVSGASNLVKGDRNGVDDIFVHDRREGVMERVNLNSKGNAGDAPSKSASISEDGRFVAFASSAGNLVRGDFNHSMDVFVRDRETLTTTRVSVSSDGLEANSSSFDPRISADGRFVVFTSDADNLVDGDTNTRLDVFRHDLDTGITARVSVDSTGHQALGDSVTPSVSGDGRFVAFASDARNLVEADRNRRQDIFLRDMETGETHKITVGVRGRGANGSNRHPSVSGDGTRIAFESDATNLVTGDTNFASDIFVHDRNLGMTSRVSVGIQGRQGSADSRAPSISSNGQIVVFRSSDLLPESHGIQIYSRDLDRERTRILSVEESGSAAQGASTFAGISGDGRMVAFASNASNLQRGLDVDQFQLFVRGPELTLETDTPVVEGGDELRFVAWHGIPGAPVLLYSTQVGGMPFFMEVLRGRFDSRGIWNFAGIVPDEFFETDVRFLILAQGGVSQEVTDSNEVHVTFQ